MSPAKLRTKKDTNFSAAPNFTGVTPMARSDQGLIRSLELALQSATEPLTCIQLWDTSDVKLYASSPNRVSDYLGNLWRRGLVLRTPAPRLHNSSARWAYLWKGQDPHPAAPVYSASTEVFAKSDNSGGTVYQSGAVDIKDDGGTITINLPAFTITIQSKK